MMAMKRILTITLSVVSYARTETLQWNVTRWSSSSHGGAHDQDPRVVADGHDALNPRG
jgi:hypothetical protein